MARLCRETGARAPRDAIAGYFEAFGSRASREEGGGEAPGLGRSPPREDAGVYLHYVPAAAADGSFDSRGLPNASRVPVREKS
jgi:hypothetical protein